ncbi:hypothetical protein C4K37_4103 [Pseudomonas chlororaphis subsp. piscium]|nr:hypothetical protein C4K37_4103 [Pseudomonas chlororaphis subsp. piscium]AZC45035.1 hypothetical protein C4K36_4114 [Pseudomonas chlororaphis subsp. piscium]
MFFLLHLMFFINSRFSSSKKTWFRPVVAFNGLRCYVTIF